ncbi:hypothetical protein NL676_003220 [Syzygium grande]|nr:hypothetical protein NL676_003220 [Syzygium grande]
MNSWRWRSEKSSREHAEQLPRGTCGASCFWADVEELTLASANPSNEQQASDLAKKLKEWHSKGEVKKDAFLKETTLVKWWRTLPDNYEAKSSSSKFS